MLKYLKSVSFIMLVSLLSIGCSNQINLKTKSVCPTFIGASKVSCNVVPLNIEASINDKENFKSIVISSESGILFVKIKPNDEIKRVDFGTRVRYTKNDIVKVVVENNMTKELSDSQIISVHEDVGIPLDGIDTKGKLRRKFEFGVLKLLFRSDMAFNDYINKIIIEEDGRNTYIIELTPYITRNPYIRLKLNENTKIVNIKYYTNNGKELSAQVSK